MKNELYHHGILGMKWGVRRYQRRNGKLTPLGRIRVRKMQKEYQKNISKEKAENSNSKTDLSYLSDEELNARIRRLENEKRYNDLVTPKKVEKGKTFTSQLLDSLKTKAANELSDLAAKQGRAFLESALGLNKKTVDPLTSLEREFKSYNYKVQTKKLKKELENMD